MTKVGIPVRMQKKLEAQEDMPNARDETTIKTE